MKFIIKHLRIYCIRCLMKTAHTYRDDLQSPHGLSWQCDRCKTVSAHTSHALRTAERV